MNTPVELRTTAQSYQLLFDNRAYRRLEGDLGRPFAQIRHDSLADLTALLWAGLLRHQSGATLETADAIIDELGYEAVMAVVTKAVEQSPPFRGRTASA